MNLLQQISNNKNLKKPVIYGVKGLELSDEERLFFKENGCVGFILFARNIKDKQQLKKLTASLRELMEGDLLILIDQEGGRVARMRPPHWSEYPSGKFFADKYLFDRQGAVNAIRGNYDAIAKDLVEVGINVDCAPLLDVSCEITHDVIGDRAYGDNVEQITDLARGVCEGLLKNDVYPVIKHIPGHGRGACDSHLELPTVNVSLKELQETDFAVFKNFVDQKLAMTAHILYQDIDDQNCATNSKKVIDIIRNEIGFKNILMTDDLSMKALKGSFADRARSALVAGCDLILHCNGDLAEMQQINQGLEIINDNLLEKLNTN